MKKILLASFLAATSINLAQAFVLEDVKTEGVSPAVGLSVVDSLGLKKGQNIDKSKISGIISRLYATGSYRNIEARQDGNILVLEFDPYNTVVDLEIKGSKSIPKEALMDSLKQASIAKGELLDQTSLDNFKKGLLEHYQTIGRYNATVDFDQKDIGNNRVELKLNINEGDVALVKNINFVGNKSFKKSKLLDQIKIAPNSPWWDLFSSSKFDQNKLQADLDKIRDFYISRGYAKYALKNVDVNLSENKEDVDLSISLSEGKVYKIANVDIKGNMAGKEAELNKIIAQLRKGDVFDGVLVRNIEQELKDKLGEYGYGVPKINLLPRFNDENGKVELYYLVDAGKRYYVHEIRFAGNDTSADSTLRQEMRQQEGTWLSSTLLNLGKTRLERTGFFESVELKTVPVAGVGDQLDAIYTVKERNTGSISAGIGYGTESGLSYQLSAKQDNFLGKGSAVSISGQKDEYSTNLNFSYNEPYFTKDGISMGVDAFYETYDNKSSKTSARYSRTTYGLSSNLGFPVNENNYFYIGLGYVSSKIKNIDPEYNRAMYLKSLKLDKWKFKSGDFELFLGWTYNNLNRGFFPTEGTLLRLTARVTTPGSDNNYLRTKADLSNYFPLTKSHNFVLLSRASFSYAKGLGGKKVPFYQYYTAGGIGSLRGFSYGAVGPKAIYAADTSLASVSTNKNKYNNINYDVVGGNAMATASVELVVPTPFISDKHQSSVRTSLFVDAASVWDTSWNDKKVSKFRKVSGGNVAKLVENYGDPSKIRSSFGAAFQWQSPIGTLVFSYAKPIKKYEGDQIEQFQFSIGGSF